MTWSDVGGIATAIQTIVVASALVFARGQFVEANRARRLLATTELFKMIGTDELRDLRSWALASDSSIDHTDDTSASFERARKIAVMYDRLAYLVHQGLLPRTALLEFQGDELPLLWAKLRPVVLAVRTKRNRPKYCLHFERLARPALGSWWGFTRTSPD